MVSRITLQVLVAFAAAALVATPAAAQRRSRTAAAAIERPSYGAHLGYNFDAKDLLLGAQLTYPITPRLALYPTFDYYFQSGGSLWALNGDVKPALFITTGSDDIVLLIAKDVVVPRTWVHLAGTYDGTTIAVYVDGTKYTGDPRAIELKDRLEIAIVIGRRPSHIPSTFP